MRKKKKKRSYDYRDYKPTQGKTTNSYLLGTCVGYLSRNWLVGRASVFIHWKRSIYLPQASPRDCMSLLGCSSLRLLCRHCLDSYQHIASLSYCQIKSPENDDPSLALNHLVLSSDSGAWRRFSARDGLSSQLCPLADVNLFKLFHHLYISINLGSGSSTKQIIIHLQSHQHRDRTSIYFISRPIVLIIRLSSTSHPINHPIPPLQSQAANCAKKTTNTTP